MTSHLNSHGTTDITPEIELHMINIIYAALPIRDQQKRQYFHSKATGAKLYIYIGVGPRDLYIDKAHTALDIFRFAVFFF